jgi:N-methylhydantoinase A/oxoprolinase/acetone carboxylase beta subunit
MATYCIGIDTGGTYTDAVLMDTATREIVLWAKETTTHHDLGIGVGLALEKLLAGGVSPGDIERLAVSTTLATNAIVEGRGARVGLFVFGYVRHFKLPIVANIFLKGGHTITGKEDEPLDVEGLVDTIQGLKDEVDSYAVCGAMAIKNPAHELVGEEAISMLDPGKPVFCSHKVSDHPGMRARAATACLHAKLMPLMVGFLSSIQLSMLKLKLSCPVTIICGNGRGASLDLAVERAAITMASGPAATAWFGSTAGEPTALVVDVGGTTTDVCMIREGRPVLSEEGCLIGQWQTHVEAIDMYTAGGGGDSHIICSPKKTIVLQTTRVQPLAMTPDLPDPATWLGCGTKSAIVLPVAGLDEKIVGNDPILCRLQQGAASPEMLARDTPFSGIALEKKLEQLVYLQQIQMAGFTPTDALHVLGRLELGNTDHARTGAEVLAAELDIDVTTFCKQVIWETEKTIENIILDYLGRKIWPDGQATPFLNRRNNELFSLAFSVKIPIIGIGAAARMLLPGVAEHLQTTVHFPQYYEVGNAIGAALIGMEQRHP